MNYSLTVQATGTTGRLLLRPWRETDVPAMVEAYRDPEMRRWLRTVITTTAEARQLVEARQAAHEAGDRLSFAILEATDDAPAGVLVGGISLRGLRAESGKGGVGYWVAAPARGRGIASQALDTLCEWAFGLPRTPRLVRLDLIHAVGNSASCRVAEKAGFPLSAVLPAAPPEYPHEGHLHVRMAEPGSIASKRAAR